MTKDGVPLSCVLKDYKGLIHRATHLIPTHGGFYGVAHCDYHHEGRIVSTTRSMLVTCVYCLVPR